MKRRVNLKIAGEEYRIKTEEDEEYIAELVRFVNSEFERIKSSTTTVETRKIAVLTALNISSYYFKSKADWERREKRITHLIKMIEDEL